MIVLPCGTRDTLWEGGRGEPPEGHLHVHVNCWFVVFGPFRSGEDPGGRDCSLHCQKEDPCVVHLRWVCCQAELREMVSACSPGRLYMCVCIYSICTWCVFVSAFVCVRVCVRVCVMTQLPFLFGAAVAVEQWRSQVSSSVLKSFIMLVLCMSQPVPIYSDSVDNVCSLSCGQLSTTVSFAVSLRMQRTSLTVNL